MADPRHPSQGSIKVEFPSMESDQVPILTARIIQAPGAHDIMYLTTSTPGRALPLLGGAPVTATWTDNKTRQSFYGYVYRVDQDYSTKTRVTTVICVGSSYPMMNRSTRVWSSVRASDVVREIAWRHGLSSDVEDHPRVFTMIAQAGRSDWQLLNWLAAQTGYVLRMEGTMLVFRSRQSMAAHWRPQALHLSLGALAGDSPSSFVPKTGRFNPELGASSAIRESHGIDPVNGTVVSSENPTVPLRETADPLFSAPLVDAVVHSETEAISAAVAAQEANRFVRLADIRVAGNAHLAPERMVYLTEVPDEFTGYWTVRQIEHRLGSGKYSCTAQLGTDGLGRSRYLHGEVQAPLVRDPRMLEVNPHRPGARDWSGERPVLVARTPIKGVPGAPLRDFRWTSSNCSREN